MKKERKDGRNQIVSGKGGERIKGRDEYIKQTNTGAI